MKSLQMARFPPDLGRRKVKGRDALFFYMECENLTYSSISLNNRKLRLYAGRFAVCLLSHTSLPASVETY